MRNITLRSADPRIMRHVMVTGLLTISVVLLGACDLPATPPPAAISNTWIDAPEDGTTIALAPYTVVFHSASVMGLEEFEVRVDDELLASVAPKTTGPGGSQGTLFMADYEWHPPEPGTYELVIQPKDQYGDYGPSALAMVTVAGPAAQIEQLPTGLPTLELAPTPTPTPVTAASLPGFNTPSYSATQVYWGRRGCSPTDLTVEIMHSDPTAYSIVLFYRLAVIDSDEKTDWMPMPMSPLGGGYFNLMLNPETAAVGLGSFSPMMIDIQVVATDQSGNELGRTPVYSDVMLDYCVPGSS
jgi:hypothetical protein